MIDLSTFDPDHASTADCKAAQQQLAAVGYYHDIIDGLFWGMSRAALAHWRADHASVSKFTQPAHGDLAEQILVRAERYNGLTEIVSNNKWGFITRPDERVCPAQFRAGLLGVGWSAGESYCIAAAWLIWKEAFYQEDRDFSVFSHLVSTSVLESYHRCQAANLATHRPEPGAIMFLQHGSSGLGHAGIVRAVQGSTLLTWEANTTPAPGDSARDREGDMVTNKTRPFSFAFEPGLHLLGFLNPPEVARK